MSSLPPIEILTPEAAEAEIPALAILLHACVEAGASVNFVLPFAVAEAEAWWRGTAGPGLRAGGRILLAARDEAGLAGCVMLEPAGQPNQPHRADVSKLLVHPRARRRGIARALMQALEAEAMARGRVLLTLDTRRGDPAEGLYKGMGFVEAGEIPGFCVDPIDPARLDATVIMWKRL